MPVETSNPEATRRETAAGLGAIDKMRIVRGIFDTEYFIRSARPALYRRAGNDSERMHELVMGSIKGSHIVMKLLSPLFTAPKELTIKINGVDVVPFGTAAGFDKSGDALLPLSHVFGFLEPGTVRVHARKGNDRPRLASDDANLDLYNALGFPGPDLNHFAHRMAEYRKMNGKARIYVNICGMPLSEEKAVELAMSEMEELVRRLEPYVDGFVWNCASPNTEALKLLREHHIFRQTSELMKRLAPHRLRLVKMWPYDPHEKRESLRFVESFVDGGGHGAVTTNTKLFPREQVPSAEWGYKYAGRSGSFLKPYRLRSVKDMREAFPDAVIVATGGIFDGNDAYETFRLGADMLEGYTPYAFYGLGLLRKIEEGVAMNLKKDGYSSLAELQSSVKDSAGRHDDGKHEG